MQILDEYFDYLEHNKGSAAGTVTKYRYYLVNLIKFLAERDKELLSAELSDLQEFTGIWAHEQKMCPRSRRPLVAAVRGFYVWAVRMNRLAVDPAQLVEYPKAGQKIPMQISLGNTDKLLMAANMDEFKGVRDACLIAMMAGTGIRVSGLVAMNESALVWVQNTGLDRLVIKVSEKGGKERLIPVPIEASMLLRAYLGHPDLKDIDRSLSDGDQVLFVSIRNRTIKEFQYYGENRRITVRGIQEMLKACARTAGVDVAQAHPHAFRHLYGTELAEDDADLLIRQALLGHADPKSTQIYTHMAMRKLTRTVDSSNPLGKLNAPVLRNIRKLRDRL